MLHIARTGEAQRSINKLRQWRGLATRYDKTATIYPAGLHLAAIFIWSASDPKSA
jgi:transposase